MITIGGGIITKKGLFTFLLMCTILSSGIAGASAATIGTVQAQNDNTTTIKNNVSTHSENVTNIKTSNITQTNDKNSTSTTTTTNQVTKSVNSVSNQANSLNKPTQQAAAGETFTNAQIATAAASVKQYVETNKKLPNNITINGITVNMPSFLEFLTSAVLNINSGKNTNIQNFVFGNAPNPKDTMSTGTMSKTEYLKIASDVKSFMDRTHIAPEYAYATSLGSYFGYQNVVYTYSKIMSYYATNKVLPNSVSVNSWNVVTQIKFTTSQIATAATSVKQYVETYKKLPTSVNIGSTSVSMPSFLQLLTAATLNIKNGKSTNLVPYYAVSNAPNPRDTMNSGNMGINEYISIASNVNSFINTKKVAPEYAYATSLGTYFGFQNMVYSYSKIMSYYATNNVLPNYVSVKSWNSITSTVSTQARPVYITSDNIINTVTDTNTVNTIVNALKNMGLTAVNCGLGPNTHYSVLQSSSVPANALIVDIYGGADAGVIYEMGQSYYKQLVGSKKVFCVWMPPTAIDITGLAWLPRAHDDDYDPASFTGLANPDQYLLSNGYHYIYSADLNAIISAIYKEATT